MIHAIGLVLFWLGAQLMKLSDAFHQLLTKWCTRTCHATITDRRRLWANKFIDIYGASLVQGKPDPIFDKFDMLLGVNGQNEYWYSVLLNLEEGLLPDVTQGATDPP